jgi:hypothetical protein
MIFVINNQMRSRPFHNFVFLIKIRFPSIFGVFALYCKPEGSFP